MSIEFLCHCTLVLLWKSKCEWIVSCAFFLRECSLVTVWSECLKFELLSLFQFQWLCALLCPWLCRCFRKRSVVCVSCCCCCCCCWLILIVRWWMLSKFNLIIVECVFEVVMWVLRLNLWSCALCWCCGVCARGWHWDGVIEVLSRLDWVVHWDDMLRLRDWSVESKWLKRIWCRKWIRAVVWVLCWNVEVLSVFLNLTLDVECGVSLASSLRLYSGVFLARVQDLWPH